MKSVNLNFLEASGPLQACNGAALPLLLYKDSFYSKQCEYWESFYAVVLSVKFYVVCFVRVRCVVNRFPE